MVKRAALFAIVFALCAVPGGSQSLPQFGGGGAVNYVGERKSNYSGKGGIDVPSYTTFNANISLRTTGNKQTVSMRADSQFRGADISLSK